MNFRPALLSTAIAALLAATPSKASSPMGPQNIPQRAEIPVSQHALAFFIQRFQHDLDSTEHTYDITAGIARENALRSLYLGWQARLGEFDRAKFSAEDRIDAALFRRELTYRLSQLDFEHARNAEALKLLPEVAPLIALAEQRRALMPLDAARARQLIDRAASALTAEESRLRSAPAPSPVIALRASKLLSAFREDFKQWHTFYNGYDPAYTKQVAKSYEALDKQLESTAKFLRNDIAKAADPETIIGDPIGRDAVEAALRYEMIPYTPEQIVQLAERELRWCQEEMRKAAAEMGYADWHDALEQIKKDGPAVGDQPQYVVKLADEAIDYVERNRLVTVPELAKRDWRMTMLSPEYQLQAPFFLGGEDVWVAYPHDSMPAEKQAMALRGNNRYFSRAVVHHELIPGHHLQHFYNSRYNSHRELFGTPFWTEGWALYWEFLLYQKGFAKTPEQKLGMLFWRSHRAARILFSLSFHMGTMTPQQSIDMLVERVGHERANAAAEVRRSFAGDYGPLYQAAYMLGGLQFWELRRELVESGKMTDREFHDAILKGGPMPVSVVRSRLMGTDPDPDLKPDWRFYPALDAK
ncbi:DUF885 domain-containing protein [Arenimonas sp. GDDSR-1]|uniref:DUF885 domain-containing protein n=1 Tax=Arenimonas sp. GDDSR-1 TaxID=2950125 RepID=UPI00261D0FF9|nr:DUF885 domain-containing protein [Arenimonas sp. GDDSR-1]